MIASVCVARQRTDLQLCFHFEHNPLKALTAEIILNSLISLHHGISSDASDIFEGGICGCTEALGRE